MDELDLDYYLTSQDEEDFMTDVVSLYYNSPAYIPDTPFEDLPPETQEQLILKVMTSEVNKLSEKGGQHVANTNPSV